MKLPNGQDAIVEDRKLLEYLLNPLHPVGRHHARMFKRLLGIDTGTAAILKNALQKAAVEEEVAEEIVTMFGIKYVTRFEISYSDYRSAVVAVWIVENNSTRPRLVTCYVE